MHLGYRLYAPAAGLGLRGVGVVVNVSFAQVFVLHVFVREVAMRDGRVVVLVLVL